MEWPDNIWYEFRNTLISFLCDDCKSVSISPQKCWLNNYLPLSLHILDKLSQFVTIDKLLVPRNGDCKFTEIW